MFLYQIKDDHARILGCRGYDGSVRIPEKIGGRPVTELLPMHSPMVGGKEKCFHWQEKRYACAMKRATQL